MFDRNIRNTRALTRREFLMRSAAASVAIGLPAIVPSSVFGADAPSNRITMGCIGTGGQANNRRAKFRLAFHFGFFQMAMTVDDATPDVGDQINYLISLTNLGPQDATAVEVTDILPAGLAYESQSASHGNYEELAGIWMLGDLASGDSACSYEIRPKSKAE